MADPHTLAYAVDPREGDNALERYGPLAVVLAWLACTVCVVAGVFDLAGPAAAVYASLSSLAAYWLRGMAQPSRTPPAATRSVDTTLMGSARRRQR